jgi:hypothetical protein
MERDEKIALKAACIQAAAILLAPLYHGASPRQDSNRISADTANCVRHARDLFGKLTGEPWDEEPR